MGLLVSCTTAVLLLYYCFRLDTTLVDSHDAWEPVMMQIRTTFSDTFFSETGPPFRGGGRPEKDTRNGSPKITSFGSITVATRFGDPLVKMSIDPNLIELTADVFTTI